MAQLAITWLVQIDWDAIDVDLFLFKYERSKFIFIPPVAIVTRKRVDGTKVIEYGHNEIRPDFREEFTDCVMSRLFR